jgi:hypothetical protein
MHHLIDLHVTGRKELREATESGREYYPEDGKDCLGFGICNGFHGDIEYFYAVQGTTLKVYAVHWPVEDDEPQVKHFRSLRTLQLAPKKLRQLSDSIAKSA